MKVVLLCGGQGMRLREETEFRPKPMVAIGQRPIIWHIMKRYAAFGFTDFVLCLGYKGEMLKDYFLTYHLTSGDVRVTLGLPPEIEVMRAPQEAGWSVTLADTGLSAMTGARIKKVEPYVDGDDFMLTYGDGVSDVDFHDLLAFHRKHGRIATVTGVFPPARFGELVTAGDQVTDFREKPQVQEGRISGGFFVLNRRVFDYLSSDEDCIFERGPLAQLAEDGEMMMYRHDSFWQCMDNRRDLDLLLEMWGSGQAPWVCW
jgi:glucose-1-phosphate cytidylyltransferase